VPILLYTLVVYDGGAVCALVVFSFAKKSTENTSQRRKMPTWWLNAK
jgi:hypothetical protein